MRPLVKRLITWGTASVVAASIGIIGAFEGNKTTAYLDTVANPPIWTVCYGTTNPKYAFEGARYTEKQCLEMLTEDIILHHKEMRGCVKAPLALWEEAAVLSMFYNMGATKMCPSTLVRKINAGEPPESFCPEIKRWAFAGGKDCRIPSSGCGGIPKRREAEYNLCMGKSSAWLLRPTTLQSFYVT